MPRMSPGMCKLRLLAPLVLALLCVGYLQAATQNVLDNFTEGPGSFDLTAHDPDTGAGVGDWAEAEDTGVNALAINGNNDVAACNPCATASRVIYTMTPDSALGSADYDVYFTIAGMASAQADTDPIGILARWQSAGNYYVAGVTTETTQTMFIGKRVTDAWTSLASSTSFTAIATDVLKFTLRTDTLKLYQNGTERLGVVDAAHTATGAAGIALGNFGGTSTADVNASNGVDVWTLDDATGDGGDDNCSAGSSAPRGMLLGVLPFMTPGWRSW